MINEQRKSLRENIREAINRASAENGSNTPDFILAEFLDNCLFAFDIAAARRDEWYEANVDSAAPPFPAALRRALREGGYLDKGEPER